MADPTSTEVLLEVEGAQKRFGQTQALRNGQLTVRAGEVHALLGGNGAGKSTLISLIAGAARPDGGTIRVGGREVEFHNPRAALQQGIAVVYQELSILPHLTVAENVGLGNPALRSGGAFQWGQAREVAHSALAALGEHAALIDPDTPISRLRPDQQQLVEIARAVTLGASVILLDEPTSSLNHDEIDRLFGVVSELRGRGLGFVFVSHRMPEIRRLCDRVTILRDGGTVVDGVPLSEIDDGAMIQAMLGTALSEQLEEPGSSNVPVRDVVLHMSPGRRGALPLEVRGGEVVGLAGLAGAGRSSILRRLWGAVPLSQDVYLDGEAYRPGSPRGAMARRVAFVGEDRATDGVFLDLSIGETLMAPTRVLHGGRLREREERALVEQIVETLDVRVDSAATLVRQLSGGNQQKLLFGRWLPMHPRLVLLDEPTRGVDLATKVVLYDLIERLAVSGAAVLVVSSEMAELVALARRIYVVEEGEAVDELQEPLTEDRVLAAISARTIEEEETHV
jgi:ribose transport system ATP-binding protein